MRMERDDDFFVGKFFSRSFYRLFNRRRMMCIIVIYQSARWCFALVFKPAPRTFEIEESAVGILFLQMRECGARRSLRGARVHCIEFSYQLELGHCLCRLINDG